MKDKMEFGKLLDKIKDERNFSVECVPREEFVKQYGRTRFVLLIPTDEME